MMAKKAPDPETETDDHDPYAIRSLEQLFTLLDAGEFLAQFMHDHRDLMQKLRTHNDEYPSKGARGSFTLSVGYSLSPAGDLQIEASADFKPPKKPSSKGMAYVEPDGQITLHSPLMKRMHGGVRDATNYDPETGEVRDV